MKFDFCGSKQAEQASAAPKVKPTPVDDFVRLMMPTFRFKWREYDNQVL